MGEMMPLRELATEHSKMWAFNGIVGGYENLLAEVARARLLCCGSGTIRAGSMPRIFMASISG